MDSDVPASDAPPPASPLENVGPALLAQGAMGPPRRRGKRTVPLLFLNVLVIAVCGLVYELLAGSVASYLLGDSITQFSVVIGLYLSAMGVGAWLSRFLETDLGRRFVELQLAIALVGGLSAPLLFLAFGRAHAFRPVLFLDVFAIGALVGLELPLLMRILERDLDLKELVARVLAFDYLGALFASLLFPLFFVPHLGLVRTSLVMGLVNAAVGLWATSLLADQIGAKDASPTARLRTVAGLRARAVVVAAVLVVGLVKADALSHLAEEELFTDAVVYSKDTPYQRIVMTQGKQGFSLFLNGNLQFASADEYRYHEALVHPAMAGAARAKSVLVLGGGDGLALREIWKHGGVEHVTLVDLDPAMTSLSAAFPPLAKLNGHAFDDPRLTVVHEDAFVWLEEHGEQRFDVAIVDFPDPNHYGLGKLYTRRFYSLLARVVADDGCATVQATSPLFVRKSYWTVVTTLEAAGWSVHPYQATVPSFGLWGFALATKQPRPIPPHVDGGGALPPGSLRFLDDATLASLFVFSADTARVPAEVNRLDNQALVTVYEAESARWER